MSDEWTREDERRFRAMQERRDKVMAAHFKALHVVVVRALQGGQVGDSYIDQEACEAIAAALLKHADDLRDALEPYDSGVRVTEAKA